MTTPVILDENHKFSEFQRFSQSGSYPVAWRVFLTACTVGKRQGGCSLYGDQNVNAHFYSRWLRSHLMKEKQSARQIQEILDTRDIRQVTSLLRFGTGPPAIKIIHVIFTSSFYGSVMIVIVSLAALAHLSTSFCLKGLTVLTP